MISSVTIRRYFVGLLGLVFAIAYHSFNPVSLKTEAAQTNQIVVSVPSDPQTFNYALNYQSPSVFEFSYEGLVRENGVTGEIEPALAERWDIAADKLHIIFTLREGLKWSDGQPLTVDDVVFTYKDIYFNEQIPTDVRDLFKVGNNRTLPSVRKLDKRRVEFTLPELFAPFLRYTSQAILPAHALRESITSKDAGGQLRFLSTWGTDTDPANVIVNGPYQIERYTPGQQVMFRRNPYYWRKDKQGNSQPYIDRIIWKIIASRDTQLLKFRSGELDIYNLRPEDFQPLQQEEKSGKFTIYKGGPAIGTTFITFNLNKGWRDGLPLVDPIKSRWFNTVAFRQAIAYGIDRQRAIDKIFHGFGEPQNSPIAVQSQYYLSPAQGLKVYDYNPELARKLLTSAGFKYDRTGSLLDAEGNRVRFTLITNSENKTPTEMALQIKQDLDKIGIGVDLQLISFNSFVDKVYSSMDWECTLQSFTGGVEPHAGFNIWSPDGGLHSFNQKPQPGQPPIEGREVADWETQIGRLYIEGAREVNEAKRKAIYAETQRITQEYLPMIYLVKALSMSAVRDRIQNVKYSALGGAVWNIYELKVSD